MKLALGTVQFGLDYGISTKTGKTPYDEVKRILHFAKLKQLEVLDTANSYGESEAVLGKAMPKDNSFKIVTKVPGTNKEIIDLEVVQRLESSILNSLEKLQMDSLYGVMFHNVSDLFKENGYLLYDKLVEMKEKRIITKIGFSVYECNEIKKLIDTYDFDIIQLPVNILDQRVINSGYLEILKKMNVEIYARSTFLQGILLMSLEDLPIHFNSIESTLRDYQELLKKNNMTLIDGALDFIKNIKEIDYVVIGVNNLKQLNELEQSFDKEKYFKDIDYSPFACENVEIIDPRQWPKK